MDRARHQLGLWQRCLKFDQAARHMIVGGDDIERVVSARFHPTAGFDGVAKGIIGVVAQRDATIQGRTVYLSVPQQGDLIDSRIHSRDEELFRGTL